MNHRTEILSLRDALEVLRAEPGQLVETCAEKTPRAFDRNALPLYIDDFAN